MFSLANTIATNLVKWRGPLLIVGVLLALLAAPTSRRLEFDRSVENLFSPDDPLMAPFKKLQRTFGSDEVVVAVYTDPDLLKPDHSGIRRLAKIRERIEKEVDGIEGLLSLDLLLEYKPPEEKQADGDNGEEVALKRFYLPIDRDTADSELGLRAVALFDGYTHSGESDAAAVVCVLQPLSRSPVSRKTTVEQLRRAVENLPDDLSPGMVAGEAVMISDGFDLIERDGNRLAWVSSVLLGIIILICFRDVRWVAAPIAVVHLTLILTKAILVLSGMQLTMVSSMLTAIVTVVGVATVVHVIVRFQEGQERGLTAKKSLIAAGTILVTPIFWACFTDAVGFYSLNVAAVAPVQQFGTMLALGALLVIVSAALLVPGMSLLFREDKSDHSAHVGAGLDRRLVHLVGDVEKRPFVLAVSLAIGTIVVGLGTLRWEVESDFTRNFRQKSQVVQSYNFVEEKLGGAGAWDVLLPAPPPEHLSKTYLKRVLRLEERLRDEVVLPDENKTPGLTKVISLADAVKTGSFVDFESRWLTDSLVRSGVSRMRQKLPAFVDALHAEDPDNPGQHWFRVMLRSKERQPSAYKKELIRQVNEIVADETKNWKTERKPVVTGYFVLLTDLVDSMLRDQWLTFGVAALGIAITMLIALRNPLLALIALVPNAMPIFLVLGAMGWLGIKVNMGTAMIAAVSMGLSIDSSIHYLSAFQRNRREGKSVHNSLEDVHRNVGRAIAFSTFALIAGFAVLITSEFVPTVYFGSLVSLAMLGGLFGNLVVLPLLITLLVRDKGREAWDEG
jgi:predicted RND superfamily exporter protein